MLTRVETKKFLLLLSRQAPQLEQDLRRYSREAAKWRIETTFSVAAVISAYESFPPDLIVLDPAAIEGDLTTLLEHAKRNWPRTFFSLLSDQPEAAFQVVSERFGSLPMIVPGSSPDVSREIEKEMVGLVNGKLQGLMLSSFLQMMEWESKSVSIHVSAAERWGRIHLHQGKFVSAYVHPLNLTDKEAAIEILTWDNISIAVERSYHNHKNSPLVAALVTDHGRDGEKGRGDTDRAFAGACQQRDSRGHQATNFSSARTRSALPLASVAGQRRADGGRGNRRRRDGAVHHPELGVGAE